MKTTFLSTLSGALLLLLSLGQAGAQISRGGTPRSLSMGLSLSEFPVMQMPAFSVQAMLDEDAKNASVKTHLARFGKKWDADLGLDNAGAWLSLPDGGRLWRQGIKSDGAYSINLIFSEYRLPEGATLFIYNRKGSSIIGAFTSINNKPAGKLGTGLVQGDEIVVEYYEPAEVAGKGRLRIGSIVHAYKNFFTVNASQGYGASGACNMNVNCPDGAPWQTEKLGVAKIIVNGNDWCSGSLINDAKVDGTPFFLTANHCEVGQDVTTWVFSFNYESPSCTNAQPLVTQTVSGAILRATNHASDFCLLELSEVPPRSYNTYLNGYSTTLTAPDSGVSIHHPSGDIKKISFFDHQLATSVMTGAACWGVVWDRQTTTEGGSSGSPMLNQDHKIIGQLYGGGAQCTNLTGMDNYGRFNVSWYSGGTDNATRIQPWLDPDNNSSGDQTGIYTKCTARAPFLPLQEPFDEVSLGLPKSWSTEDSGNVNSAWKLSNKGSRNSTKSVWAQNFTGTAGTVNKLYLPNYNLKYYNNIKFSFDYAYGRKAVTNADTLAIYAATSCNSPYVLLWKKGGADLVTHQGLVAGSYSPTATDWVTDTASLPASFDLSPYVSFVIVNISKAGNNIYLDNINVTASQPPLPPVAVFASTQPSGCPGLSVTFHDSSHFSPVSYAWSFPGGTPVTSTARRPTVTYTSPGSYTVQLIATNQYGSDTIVTDNYVNIQTIPTGPVPIAEGFENPNPLDNWTLTSHFADSSWRVYSGAGSLGSTTCIRIDDYDDAAIGGIAAIQSKAFDMTTALSPVVSFDYAYQLYNAGTADSLFFAYSTDCGATFTRLWQKGGAQLATKTGNSGNRLFVPAANNWGTATITLPASVMNQTGVLFELASINAYGQAIYADNISIGGCQNPVVGRTNITVCSGDSIKFAASAAGTGNSFIWSGPNSFHSAVAAPNIASAALTDSGTYLVTLANTRCGVSAPVKIHVNVLDLAAPTVTLHNDSLFANPILPGATYRWYDSLGHAVPGANQPAFKPATSGGYYVRVLAGTCIQVSATIHYTKPLGLTALTEKAELNLYPNPTAGMVRAEVQSSRSGMVNILVTDLSGKLLQETEFVKPAGLGNALIDLQALPQGMYLVKMVHQGLSAVKLLTKVD